MEEIQEQIRIILGWYRSQGPKAGIDDLLNSRDHLAILSYGLAQQSGDYFISYNDFYFKRVIYSAKKINDLVKSGMAVNKAENEAKEDSQEIMQAEKDAEGLAFLSDKLLKQTNKVLEAMNQRIAYLKQEKYQTERQDSP